MSDLVLYLFISQYSKLLVCFCLRFYSGTVSSNVFKNINNKKNIKLMKNSESNFHFIIYFSDSDCELFNDDSFIQKRTTPNPIVDTPNLSLR